MPLKVKVGTRGSDLALWQANYTQQLLAEKGVEAELVIIKTKGDKIQDIGFDKMEGKGFFTKEIEQALLDKSIDCAIHSHKDLETTQPEGLEIACIPERAELRDVLLINPSFYDEKEKFCLKKNARVGTSSARRKNLMHFFREDVSLVDLRGNVPTRIQKLKDGAYDAIILAAAGIERLQLDVSDLNPTYLDAAEFVPAPAQGALAIQIRSEDHALKAILNAIEDAQTAEAIGLERKCMKIFGGGCKVPFAAHYSYDNQEERHGLVFSYAKNWDDVPYISYEKAKSKDNLLKRIAAIDVGLMKEKKIFVSRNLNPNSIIAKCCAFYKMDLQAKALIDIATIPFKIDIPKTEWVFFSSKNAVHHFFKQNPKLGTVKYAVIGKGTNMELRKWGKRADFIGASLKTKGTGKQFANIVGRSLVLFPQAKGSIQSIQKQMIDPNQIKNLAVYESTLYKEKVQAADVYLFTSPSNVQAFFSAGNSIKKGTAVVAMGSASKNALKEFEVFHPTLVDDFSEAGMIRAINRSIQLHFNKNY